MAPQAERLLRHIHALAARTATRSVSDAALLDRFVRRRDEDAFAALVARHGPLVLGVCRRVLGDAHEAEDVFQATFLVLARKAASLRRPDALAAWLYGTARHLAMKWRRAGTRRRQREALAPRSSHGSDPADPLDRITARELLLVLDEELHRLPEVYRLPLILCGLEGRPQKEAARLLGWTEASLRGRLERGRARLQSRLARRGFAGAGVLLTAGLARAGAAGAARLATQGAALVRAVLQGCSAARVPRVACLLLLGVALAAGASLLTPGAQPVNGAPDSPRGATPPPAGEGPAQQAGKPARADRYGDSLPPEALARMGTVRLRHPHHVMWGAFSPDGKTLVSRASIMGENRTGPIIFWETATGKELRRVGDYLNLGAPAFTPDGKMLAAFVGEREVCFWEAATGKELRRLKIPSGFGPLGGLLAFARDGKVLAVGGLAEVGSAKTVLLVDATSGALIRPLAAHPEEVIHSLALSGDGKVAAAGGAIEGTIALWDTATGKEVRRLQGHRKRVLALAFSEDGKLLASASEDRSARLWDVATGKELKRLRYEERFGGEVNRIRFLPGGRRLVASSYASVRVWDVASGEEVGKMPGGPAGLLDLSPDGKTLAMSGENGQIVLRQLGTGKRLLTPEGHQRPVGSVALSPDGKTLATGSWDETLRLWETGTGKELRRHQLAFNVQLAFTPDGKTILAGSYDGLLRTYDAATGKELRRFLAHKGGVRRVVMSPGGETFATAGEDKAIRLWKAGSGAEIRRFIGHKGWVGDVTLAPDGKALASVGEDGSLRLWDVSTGKEVRQFRSPNGWLGSVALAPDGRAVAAAGEGKEVYVWELPSGEMRRLKGNRDWVSAVRFSPDGRILASAGHDGTVRLWEVATGKERRRFLGHRGPAFTLSFSRDGRRLVSGGIDATALVWDVSLRADPGKGGQSPRWEELGAEDAASAYRAMRALARDPAGAIRLVRDSLAPVPAGDGARVARWLADLGSGKFAAREKARQELAKRGPAVEAALRKLLDSGPPLEVRQRVQDLLAKWNGPARLRVLRAVELLEQLGTDESRRLLEAFAAGAPEALLTSEARAALARRGVRPAAAP